MIEPFDAWDRLDPRVLLFDDYAKIVEAQAALGVTNVDEELRLISRTTGRAISRWGVVNGVWVPLGPVFFDRVTNSQYGEALAAGAT
jgi:hypothetical protein